MNLDRYNNRVAAWARAFTNVLRQQAQSMGIAHQEAGPSEGASVPKMRTAVGKKSGVAERISIKNIRRSLIYTHYGAGKGRGGTTGSTWINQWGNRARTNPKSMGKMGTAGRKAKPFITAAFDSPAGIEALADIAAEELAAAVTTNIFKQLK